MTRIISFHNGNIPQDVLKAQRSVFDKFGLPIEQIETGRQHPDAIDYFLNSERWETVVIFDIDCIPLEAGYVEREVEFCQSRKYLSGAIQHASHIPNSSDYVSPAFMVLTRDVYTDLGKPSFAATPRGDVGAELTYQAREKGINVFMLPVFAVEKPMWQLENGLWFGIGTNYADLIYHAFESRMNLDARMRFINKCRSITDGE